MVPAGQTPEHLGVEVYRRTWGERPNPRIVTLLHVAGLAHADYLFDIETSAAVFPGG